jgi:membrane-bound lytic murein transglycosylase D
MSVEAVRPGHSSNKNIQYVQVSLTLIRKLDVARRWFALIVGGIACAVITGCPQAAKSPAGKSKQAVAPAIQTAPAAAAGSTEHSAAAANPQKTTPASSDTQRLIDDAQAAYKSGLANYNAGKLDLARADFDHAVDLMLTSGRDLRNDPVLSDAFEHLVDNVNAVEMLALKQGNGFSPAEPTLVELANDVTFPVDPNIKATAEAELKTTQSDLPLVMNDYVASYINFFSNSPKGHSTILNTLQRAGRYREMIQQVLRDEKVPQDLIYQAVAESGFKPQALNARSGAAGMWQFMPYSMNGMTRNAWFDERFDPLKSTHAYARYIKELYNQFGDWYLAMAAYDWGPGNVQRAVQRTGYADFWELYRRNALPTETKNYVPIILAATIMAKNPGQYGLNGEIDPPLVVDTVSTNYAIDLRLVSDLVEIPVADVAALNPSLLRMQTPNNIPFDLHIPAGTKPLFDERVGQIPEEKRASWRYHLLTDQDTLESVARTYHVAPTEVAAVNRIGADGDLSQSDALILPVAPAVAPSVVHASRYKTRKGDTVVTVADRFGVTTAQLRHWNKLQGSRLTPGRMLAVSEPIHLAPRGVGSRHRRGRGHAAARGTSHSSSHSRSSSRTASGGKKKAATLRAASSSRHSPAPAGTGPTKTKH